ncbi:FUSC family protein [Actinomycetota bacterium]
MLRLVWPGHPRRWRDVPGRLKPELGRILRLTTAAVIAYLLTVAFTEGQLDLTGALTALLVVQASSFSTLRMGIVRVGAVVTGVLVAVLLTTFAGLTWWSLGLAVASSLLLAKVLRLGHQALETPISAMLILGVHGQQVAVETRVLTTLIGTAVGIAFTLLLPPAVPVPQAVGAVRRVAGSTARVLRRAGEGVRSQPITRSRADSWLDDARAVSVRVGEASELVAEVKDARMLHPASLATRSAEPTLRTGLSTLESTALAVRSMLTLVQRAAPEEAPEAVGDDDGFGGEVRAAFAHVLETMSGSVEAFGELLEAEVAGREEEAARALAESLDGLRESRAVLTELMFVDARAEPTLWLLRGSILSAVEAVLDQLDVDQRGRLRSELADDQRLPPLEVWSRSRQSARERRGQPWRTARPPRQRPDGAGPGE